MDTKSALKDIICSHPDLRMDLEGVPCSGTAGRLSINIHPKPKTKIYCMKCGRVFRYSQRMLMRCISQPQYAFTAKMFGMQAV
ncbi:MAG: hypothetical protein KCHDKBKB_00714 [Elusimicrobia bacterium]|nr:hypothetical protein [Elusimicrobiota bacterium]